MISIVTLKALSDMAFYYTFAGLLAGSFGASVVVMPICLLLQVVAFVISYLLREKGRVRYLPLLVPAAYLAVFGTCPLSP